MHPGVRESIDRAAKILLEAGASAVYVFGSAVEDQALPGREPRDIDLAVEGLPPSSYIRTVGRLLWELPIEVDLIDLDSANPFVRRLRESGRLRRVA